MKKFLMLGLAALGLSSCNIAFVGDSFIRNPTMSSNYYAFINGTRTDIICENRETFVTAEFTFGGSLRGWDAALKGESGLDRAFNDRVDASEAPSFINGNKATVTYSVPSSTAPRSRNGLIQSQAIVVTPADGEVQITGPRIGRTFLEIRALFDEGRSDTLKSDNSLPIYNCL